jgi:hypothetical protein
MSVLKKWPRYFRKINNNLKDRKYHVNYLIGAF